MIKKVKISEFLKCNDEIIKPINANKLNLKRLYKIDFDGNIHFKEKKTNTNMIKIKNNTFVISGINVLKGASALYKGKEDILATIHYSSYNVDEKKMFIPYFKYYLKSSLFLNNLGNKKKSGIKTEIKPDQFLDTEIQILENTEIQKQKSILIDNNIKKINKLKKLIKSQKEKLNNIYETIYSELYNEAHKKGTLKKLSDLIKTKPKNGYSPKPVKYETKYKSLILSATTSGFFKKEKFKFVEDVQDKINKNPELLINENDILIQRGNTKEFVGVSALVDEKLTNYIYPDLMMKIQCSKDIIPKYLHCMLMSYQVRNYFRSKSKGTSKSMPKINQNTVQNALIPFIKDKKLQQEIINKSLNKIKKIKSLENIFEKINIDNKIEKNVINKFLLN